jgi:K+-sensing histidine kinase KdpD
MRIQNSKSWVKYSFRQALAGSGLILLSAFLIRYALQPLIEPYAPFHFFIVACLFIAYVYGYQFALLGTFVSAFFGSYFFVKPYFSFDIATASDIIQFINFASVTLISVFIIEHLQRTLYARRMVLKIMESRHRVSLFRENDRIYFSKKNNEAWSILEEILTDFDNIIFLKFADGNIKPEPLFLALAKTDQTVFSDDAWQALIHPEDVPVLLSKLSQVALKSGLVSVFDLRFAHNPKADPYRVQLESYEFMGKPLKLLRLSAG